MNCPKCKSSLTKTISSWESTESEQKWQQYAVLKAKCDHFNHVHTPLPVLGLKLGWALAKGVLTTMWECLICKHRWRKW